MFGFSVLTSEGVALCRAAAKASKKIVFTRAYCGSDYDNDRGDLAGKDLGWFDGAEGTISAVSTANNILQVLASFSAVDSGKDPVKSVCICAQEAIDGDDPEYKKADDVLFACCTDDNASYVSGDAFSVFFNLPIACTSLVDPVGNMPNNAGLNVVSFTAGEGGADGVLQVKLADGTVVDIAANGHT